MDEYPSDWQNRAEIRTRIRAEQRARAERDAARLGRSIKCGIDKRHADQVGGCANDGTGCVCECHDGPTAVITIGQED